MPMVAPHMGRKQPLHPTAEIAIVMGPQEEMEMVRHQAVTEQINGYALASLGNRLDKKPRSRTACERRSPDGCPCSERGTKSHRLRLVRSLAYRQGIRHNAPRQ
jgi:hypothetical protein